MNNKGFTLIELMVVVVILSILGGFVAYQFMDKPNEARVSEAKIQMQALGNALKMYKLDNGDYPATEQGLQALVEKPAVGNVPVKWRVGGYLDSTTVPKDPWGNPFVYLCPGLHNPNGFDLMSYGLDGQPGGDNFNSDIGNWETETKQ